MRTTVLGGLTEGPLSAHVGLAVLRVFSGLALAFAHGVGKIPPPDGFVDAVEKLGFPLPVLFAWAAGLSEFVGGLLLALGLLTRPAALLVLVTMTVAAFGQHADDPFMTAERAYLYGAVAVLFVCAGSGRLGLDRVIGR